MRSVQSFQKRVAGRLSEELVSALEPILETMASLTARIREYDRKLETVAQKLYPETQLLRQCRAWDL